MPEQCIGNHLLDNPETPPLIKEYEDPCPELYPADYLDSFSEDDVPEVIEDTLDTLDLLEELLARGYFPLQMEDTPTPDDHGEPNRDTDPANINP